MSILCTVSRLSLQKSGAGGGGGGDAYDNVFSAHARFDDGVAKHFERIL